MPETSTDKASVIKTTTRDQRPYRLKFTVYGVDLDDEATDIVVAKQFPDMLWGSCNGVTEVTLICSASNRQVSLQLARRIRDTLHSTQIRWFDDWVDYVGIARRTAVKPDISGEDISRVQDWHKNAANFPATSGALGVGTVFTPFWRWTDITRWLNTYVSPDGVAFKERYRDLLDCQELTERQIVVLNNELAKLDAR